MLPFFGIGFLSGFSLWELAVPPFVLLGSAIASVGLGNLVSQSKLNYAVVLGGTCLLISALLFADPVSRLWVNSAWWVWAWGCVGFDLSPKKGKNSLPKGAIGIGGQAIASYTVCASGLFLLSGLSEAEFLTSDLGQFVRLLLANCLFLGGIVSYGGWQCHRQDNSRKLHLHLEGIWSLEADYVIDLSRYSRIDRLKIIEVEDIHWLQLAGYSRELTLPLTLTGNPELEKTLLETSGLAKSDRRQDSFALADILLPQGASIFAGFVLAVLGIALMWSLPITLADQYAVPLLFAIGLVSPTLGRIVLHLVAPNYLESEPCQRWLLRSWELGLLIWLGLLWLVYPHAIEPFVGVSLAVGVLGTAICLLALVRRTPISHEVKV